MGVALRPSASRAASATFIAIAEVALGAVLLFRLVPLTCMRQSIWRLRNRLIVNYVLIGVIPVVLIAVVHGARRIYCRRDRSPCSSISTELDRRTQGLNEPAQILSWSTPTKPVARILNGMAPFVRTHYPRVQILMRSDQDFRYPADAQKLTAPPLGWPDTCGLMTKDGRFYTYGPT